MANNYSQFSEQIDGLSPESLVWAKKILEFNPFADGFIPDGYEGELGTDDYEKAVLEAKSAFSDMLGVDSPDMDHFEYWPQFQYQIEGSGIWLYSEEGCDIDDVIMFVQALLRKFKLDYVFTATGADFCSKLRLGEFGGWWIAVSRDNVEYGNCYHEADKAKERLMEKLKEG